MFDSLTGWVVDIFESMSTPSDHDGETASRPVRNNNTKNQGISNPALELEEEEEEEGGETDFTIIEWSNNEAPRPLEETADSCDEAACDEVDNSLDNGLESYYTYKIPTWLEAPTSNGKLCKHMVIVG